MKDDVYIKTVPLKSILCANIRTFPPADLKLAREIFGTLGIPFSPLSNEYLTGVVWPQTDDGITHIFGILTKDLTVKLLKTVNNVDISEIFGRYYGFPDCCIKEFIERDWSVGLPDRQLDGTGYIPCKKCNERYSAEGLISRIKLKRICPIPFPNNDSPTIHLFDYILNHYKVSE
jgi:hypothetical protein